MNFRIIIFLLTCFGFFSCEEDDTPIDLTQYEPFVTIGFYDTLENEVITHLDLVSPIGFNPYSFDEDAAKYKIPLDINSDKSDFGITIDGVVENLTIEYGSRVENQINVLRFILENIIVTNHSFDSVKVACELNCNSNETEIKIYR